MPNKSSSGYSSSDESTVDCILDLSKCKLRNESPSPPIIPPLTRPMLGATQNVLDAANSSHTRPFKEYTKRSLPLNASTDPDFARYREQMLPKLQKVGKESAQKPRSDSPAEKEAQDSSKWLKDATYWERRRKNNEAAKRSRDLRRTKQEHLAIRVSFLERQNMELKCKAEELAKENLIMKKMMLYSKESAHTIPHPTMPLPFIPPPHLRYPSSDLRYHPEMSGIST